LKFEITRKQSKQSNDNHTAINDSQLASTGYWPDACRARERPCRAKQGRQAAKEKRAIRVL